jgi:hypothetical protein
MAWKPLDLFKSGGSASNSNNISRNETQGVASSENTARPLFINSQIEKAFTEKRSSSIKKNSGSNK